MLADGRSFLLGPAPAWVDILAYFPIWMCRGNIADAGHLLEALPTLTAWESRVRAFGHGRASAMSATEAIEIARGSASTVEPALVPDAWPAGLKMGATVTVTPQDYGAVPVAGKLLRLTHRDIAIQRIDPRAGELTVHFPRLGYKVEATA
jgi:hypothetical protein